MLNGLLNVLLMFCSLILIFLVLIQRGKGGGLAGAFGGAGGSSAFGTKAGDIFTKITMYVAGVWILLAMVLVLTSNRERTSDWDKLTTSGSARKSTTPLKPGQTPRRGLGASDSTAGTKPRVEEKPPGSPAPAPKPQPAQPANPGDPLAPLPIEKTKTTP